MKKTKKYCCILTKDKKESKKVREYFENIPIKLTFHELVNIVDTLLNYSRKTRLLKFTESILTTPSTIDFNPSTKITYQDCCPKCLKYFIGSKIDHYKKNYKNYKKSYYELYHSKNKKTVEIEKTYSIQELIDLTRKEVIGQDDLIEKMATIFYMHQLKMKGQITSEKSVIPLITGTTGTGKTLIIRTMSRLIDVPFISFSMGSFTADGWAGNEIVSFFEQFLDHKNFDYSIVYIDEFDKIHRGDEKMESFNRLKQYRLLTIFEGEELKSDKTVIVNKTTKNMQFFLSGSYQDFNQSNKIGFNNKIEIKKNKLLTKDTIVEIGLLNELAGRITAVYNTRALEFDDYINILKHSQSGYFDYYDQILNTFNIKINYEDSFYNKIAMKAFESNYGARELNNYLFDYFQPLIKEFSNLKDKKLSKEYTNQEKLEINITHDIENDLKEIKKKIILN